MSQREDILRHLKLYGSIQPLQALQMYGCFRLGARILELKQAGERIQSVPESSGRKRWARYVLEGENGQQVMQFPAPQEATHG